MDALVAAFVAALLLGIGDRTAWLAAILSSRFDKPGAVLFGALLALAGANALAATAGALAAPILTPNAKALMLAIGCLLAGFGALFATKRPDPLAGWRGAAFTATVGLFILAFGEADQIVTAALAARSPLPWLAAVGGTLGGLVALAPAIALGEDAWRRLPLRIPRLVIGFGFLSFGLVAGISALRLS